jgi:hypothetical protein
MMVWVSTRIGLSGLFVELPQMPALPRKLRLSTQQRLGLQLLACAPFGATEAALSVDGFTRQTLLRPVRTDLQQHRAILRLAGILSVASASRRPVDGRSKVIERRLSLACLVTATARTGKRPAGLYGDTRWLMGPAASHMEEPT